MPVPEVPLLHDVIAAYVCDVYMIDPALQVHGHSMSARTHRSGTTDSSIWFHRPVRADRWNLLETRSPAAARGRGVITGSLVGADGEIAATVAQEGLIAERSRRPRTDGPGPTDPNPPARHDQQLREGDTRQHRCGHARQPVVAEQRIHLIVRDR